MILAPQMLGCCEPNIEYLATRAGSLFMLCTMVTAAALGAVFVLRNVFDFARQGFSFALMAGIAALFAGIICLVAGPTGLLSAPCLLTIDFLGRCARRSENRKDPNDTSP